MTYWRKTTVTFLSPDNWLNFNISLMVSARTFKFWSKSGIDNIDFWKKWRRRFTVFVTIFYHKQLFFKKNSFFHLQLLRQFSCQNMNGIHLVVYEIQAIKNCDNTICEGGFWPIIRDRLKISILQSDFLSRATFGFFEA